MGREVSFFRHDASLQFSSFNNNWDFLKSLKKYVILVTPLPIFFKVE